MDRGGELFSLLLRLHPIEAGQVMPGAGHHVQAAFLDLVRQSDASLADWLHRPNQRRPYTLSLLHGFNHLTKAQVDEAIATQQMLPVEPGQTYWLRITMLDATLFGAFTQSLITRSRDLTLRLGTTHFTLSRLLSTADPALATSSWVAYSSFADLFTTRAAQPRYSFEFATPTAFSHGQKAWGKLLMLFPEPAVVFESLARQWNLFAPTSLCMEQDGLSPRTLAAWCGEQVIVTHYTLETCHVSSNTFGQTGFAGKVTYEVKGNPTAPEALWLTPLARFALFCGIGYKTTMGMGQARCLNCPLPSASSVASPSLRAEEVPS